MLTIDITTARRFVLGKQGLWPGRRWRGLEGVAQAMAALEYLQLDPLQVVARSQDIALHSRVLDMARGDWEDVTYRQRRCFDWGGWLAVRPIEELPHWRTVMQRERDGHPDCDPRIRTQAHELGDTIAEMRAVLHERGVVSNRDFEMATRTRTQSYRGRKDSAVALYYLWRTGEVMTDHRENFERVYGLAEAIAPPHLLYTSDDAVADRFLIRKEVSFGGIARLNRTADAYHRGVPFSQAQRITSALLAESELIEVRVEGWKLDRGTGTLVLLGLWLEDARLGEDEAFAEALAAGCVRFARFVGARALDTSAVAEPLLHRCLQARQVVLGAV